MPGPHTQADLTDGARRGGGGHHWPNPSRGSPSLSPSSSPVPPCIQLSEPVRQRLVLGRIPLPPTHTPPRLLLEFFPFGPTHHPEAALAPPRHHLDSDPLSRIPLPRPPPPEVETRNDFPHPLHGHRHRPTRCDLTPVMSLTGSRARLHGKRTMAKRKMEGS